MDGGPTHGPASTSQTHEGSAQLAVLAVAAMYAATTDTKRWPAPLHGVARAAQPLPQPRPAIEGGTGGPPALSMP